MFPLDKSLYTEFLMYKSFFSLRCLNSSTSFRQAKSCIWKYTGVHFRFFTHLALSCPFCFTGIFLCILVIKSISLGGLQSSFSKNSLHPLHFFTTFVMKTIWRGLVNNFCLSFSLGTAMFWFVASSSELSPSDLSTFMTFFFCCVAWGFFLF